MLVSLIEKDKEKLILPMAREALLAVVNQMRETHQRIGSIKRKIQISHRSNKQSQSLETIPGVGPGRQLHCRNDYRCKPLPLGPRAGGPVPRQN